MALTQPDAVYLTSPETGRFLTFRGLREQSLALHAEFRRDGLRPGDKIAFLLDNGVFTAQLFLGAIYGGFVAVPLNVRAGVAQLAHTLEHSDAQAVYVGPEYNDLIRQVTAEVGRPIRLVPANADGLPQERGLPSSEPPEGLPDAGPEDPVLLMYTSGSTGRPKAAVHSHRTVLAGAQNSIQSHQLTAHDRSLLVLPLYHINAECVTLIPALLSGGSVVVPHRFGVSQFWDWMEDHHCTWSAVVPTIISQLLDWKDPRDGRRRTAFQRIRFLRSSSAPLSPSLHREFMDKFPLLLIQAMGSTEAGNVFSNPLPPGENKIGSAGLPWGFELRIISRDGAEMPEGEPGEVLIRGPALTGGYYKDPEATAAVFDSNGWLHTGDLAYRDGDGYVFVVGRSKELIIKGGVNIAPRQIDEVLESHPAVLEAAVVGAPDRYVGEDLVAFAVLRSGAVVSEGDLLDFCVGRLGEFKTPTRIHFVKTLPKGPSGKVQRLRLLEDRAFLDSLTQDGVSKSEEGLPPAEAGAPGSSSVEEAVAEIWTEILKIPKVGAEDNFFALGGHSLLAIQCVSRLRERLCVPFSLSDFFESATVVQQAALILPRRRNMAKQSPLPEAGGGAQGSKDRVHQDADAIPARNPAFPCPLSPAQERVWFAYQLHPGLPVYNESEAVRLRGDLNIEALELSLNRVIERHEMLRTTIKIVDERPSAHVHERWPVVLKRVDLSALEPARREDEVERLLVEEPRRLYSLESEPGIRGTLVRLGPRDHVFILMMHHIVCDWSSEGVLWRELSAHYRAFARHETLELPAAPVRHGDYAAWRQTQNSEMNFAAELDFWKNELGGAPELLDLPADRPRPAVTSHRGARRRFRLDPGLAAAAREFGRREKASLFTVFTAVLDALLHRYTGSDDILIGIPLADRDRPELQSLIGFLLHTHVLRTRLSPELTFRELLERVRKGVITLYTHRAAPFDRVVRAVQPRRNPAHTPLFQVMLNWRDQDQQLSFIGMEGLEVESLLAETRTSKFDLTLMVTDAGDDFWLEFEYNTDLFDESRIEGMLGHFQKLLASAVENPAQRLWQLSILSPAERRLILTDWNNTAADFPRDKCVHQLIEDQVSRTPEAVALVFEDQSVTYRQLDARANRLARHLRSLGVRPGELVGLCVGRSIEMVVGLLGILKSGGAYVPLDPAYPASRLQWMIEDARPVVLLTTDKLAGFLPNHSARTLLIDASAREGAVPAEITPPGRPHTPEDPAYVLHTSGSTGRPKGVRIPHRALVNFLTSMAKEPGLAGEDTLLAITTLSFDIAGLEIYLPLVAGARVVIARREQTSDAEQLIRLLRDSKATVMQATPATWRMLVESGWTGDPGLKILCGGEALPESLARELIPRGRAVWNLYGPTETTIWSAANRLRPGEPVLIGHPIANTSFHILDSHSSPVPVGVSGELLIGGDGLALGYLNLPELTDEKFIPNRFNPTPGARLYRTGDLCRYHSDGRIEFLGRLDHQVKVNGFRVETGEVEAALAAHPGVRHSVVVARQNERGDTRLAAYLEPSVPASPPTASELRALLKKALPDYMIPSAFVVLETLPLTPNGKIDREALPAPEFLRAGANGFVAPRTPVEEVLAGIWEESLGVPTVGARDNFFDLGGHSLLATRLVARVRRAFDIDLPLGSLFEAPTVEGMSAALESTASTPDEVGIRAALLLEIAELSAGEVDSMLDPGRAGGEESSWK